MLVLDHFVPSCTVISNNCFTSITHGISLAIGWKVPLTYALFCFFFFFSSKKKYAFAGSPVVIQYLLVQGRIRQRKEKVKLRNSYAVHKINRIYEGVEALTWKSKARF